VFQWGSIAIGVTAGGSREIEDPNVLPCCLPQVLNGKCEQEAEFAHSNKVALSVSTGRRRSRSGKSGSMIAGNALATYHVACLVADASPGSGKH
jgi:hypothetical protein